MLITSWSLRVEMGMKKVFLFIFFTTKFTQSVHVLHTCNTVNVLVSVMTSLK